MKYLSFFTLLILSCTNSTKLLEVTADVLFEDELRVFNDYRIYSKYYWEDTIPSNQERFYSNGIPEVQYSELIDGTKYRTELYYNGSLKSRAKIFQEYSNDTSWQINAITLEDEQFINEGYTDYIDGEYLKFKNQNFEIYTWADSKIDSQIDFWNNGNIKVRYEQSKNKTRHRFDYDSTNILLRESLVSQKYGIDTVWQIDRNTLEDVKTLDIGYKDFFEEIIFLKEPDIILYGKFENDNKVGVWTHYQDSLYSEVSYNNGILNDKYIEYYPILLDIERIKCSGSFVKKYISDTTRYGSSTTEKFVRSGKWEFYNEDESVKTLVQY